jgi:hypothetical protein
VSCCNFVSFNLCKNLPILYYHVITTKKDQQVEMETERTSVGQFLCFFFFFFFFFK